MFRDPATRRASLIGFGLVSLIVLCCAVTVIGWSQGFWRTAQEFFYEEVAFQTSLPVTEPFTLVVDHRVGNVDIRADAENEVLVEVTARARDAAVASAVEAELLAEDGEVVLALEGDEAEGLLVHLTIHTPPEVSLRLDQIVGDVEVVGLEGALVIASGTGDVRVRDQGLIGEMEVASGTGDVGVSLDAMAEGASVNISSDVGDVTLVVPDAVGFQVAAETNTGEIDADGITFESRTAEQEGVSQTLTGVVEPVEGRTITVEVGVGGITLEED